MYIFSYLINISAPLSHKNLTLMKNFTSMYLFAQMQELPTSPGLLWEKQSDGFFTKKIMTSGHSLKAQKWLEFMNVTGFERNFYKYIKS